MTLTKRFRQVWAALTQEWTELVCPKCGLHWFTQSQLRDPQCADCDVKALEAWARTELQRREQRAGLRMRLHS